MKSLCQYVYSCFFAVYVRHWRQALSLHYRLGGIGKKFATQIAIDQIAEQDACHS